MDIKEIVVFCILLLILLSNCDINEDPIFTPEINFEIIGNLFVPINIPSKNYVVCADRDTFFKNGAESEYHGICIDSSKIGYSLIIKPGEYYLYAYIDIDDSGISKEPDNDDLFGIYGSDLNWPDEPNVVTTSLVDSSFDILMQKYERVKTKSDYEIAYLSGPDLDVFKINSLGKNNKQLTNLSGDERYIKWSPDGKKIVFSSNHSGNDKIYIVESDGDNLRQLTFGPGSDLYPEWSSDGTQITFTSDRDGDTEIFVINVDGNNERQLTSNSVRDYFSCWSPINNRILFTSDRDNNYEIYIMGSDGSNQVNLSKHASIDYLGRFSPTGDKIAFISERDNSSEIYTMNTDGSDLIRMTDVRGMKGVPKLSGDGNILVFSSTKFSIPFTADGAIYTHYIMSNETKRLTTEFGMYDYPDISPDGDRILFVFEGEIYIMNINGTNKKLLLDKKAYGEEPIWSPVLSQFSE